MDHVKLLVDIVELSNVFTQSVSIEAILQKIVELVADHIKADVCSIYLFDEVKDELILKATKGLHPDSIDQVRLKLGEGIAGFALKEPQIICERVGSEHPQYKYFPGIFEEKYEAFLAVPILRGISKIGVMIVQREKKICFTEQDVMALRVVASQLGSIIENARLIMKLDETPEQKIDFDLFKEKKFVKGKVASEGFAYADAVVLDNEKSIELLFHTEFDKVYTLEDFERALALSEKQLEKLQEQVEEKLSDMASLIFVAHLMVLKDKKFVGKMRQLISEGVNPPVAITTVAREYIHIFSQSPSPYIREKVQDLQDLVIRLIGNLIADSGQPNDYREKIVISKELFPSDILKLSSEKVQGIVLVTGGVTSHLAILSRSLQIPLIIAEVPQLLAIPENTKLLLDAELGNIYINPSDEIISHFTARNAARMASLKKKRGIHQKTITSDGTQIRLMANINPSDEIISHFTARNEARMASLKQKRVFHPQTVTSDGTKIRLMANINLLTDLKVARELQADGVGLYRTEFPFLIRSNFPTEEEQFIIYRKLIEGMPGKEINFRTLDIGGDKVLSYYHNAKEQNPFLGMRSIRFSLHNKDIFRQQIRAMLRAGAQANIKIMFPMISSIDEFLEARKIVLSCMDALNRKKMDYNKNPQIGMMVEIPSVMHIIHDFAKEADFFSIGTNDLIQYLLAVDRTNEKVAEFYLPHHPSVLRGIKKVVDAATENGIEVSVCGDMAHDVRHLPFLLGIGLRILSVDPTYLPRIQEAISKISIKDAEKLADRLLKQTKVRDIEQILLKSNP